MQQPDGSGGTLVTVACFAAGTRLLTAKGERAVESLAVGDRVVTDGGRLAPVVWLGSRRVRGAFPVCVCRGAFAANVAHREVLLSPDHAVHVHGALIPIRHLANTATIVRLEVAARSPRPCARAIRRASSTPRASFR